MINLVQIQTALLIPVTGTFIVDKLGIKPAEQQGRSLLWDEKSFTDICQGIIRHVTEVRNVNFDEVNGKRPPAKGKPPAAAAAAATAAADPFDDDADPFADDDADPFDDATDDEDFFA